MDKSWMKRWYGDKKYVFSGIIVISHDWNIRVSKDATWDVKIGKSVSLLRSP